MPEHALYEETKYIHIKCNVVILVTVEILHNRFSKHHSRDIFKHFKLWPFFKKIEFPKPCSGEKKIIDFRSSKTALS